MNNLYKLILIYIFGLNNVYSGIIGTPLGINEEPEDIIKDQYEHVMTGWYLELKCNGLTFEEKNEFEWHVYYLAKPIRKRISFSIRNQMTERSTFAANSEKHKECGDESKKTIRSALNLSIQLNKLINNKIYVKLEPEKQYAFNRYASGTAVFNINIFCPDYSDEKSKIEFNKLYRLVNNELFSQYGQSFIVNKTIFNHKIKSNITCSDELEKHYTNKLGDFNSLAIDLGLKKGSATATRVKQDFASVPDVKDISASKLLENSFKVASLSAEIRRKMQVKGKYPRRKFISASTKEYMYAAYMEAWVAKVERVGALNYPVKAKKFGLSGSLALDVAINQDGSINEITIRRSSGIKILDDATIRIAELAAPYKPFTKEMKDEIDILHIMRTWQYVNGG